MCGACATHCIGRCTFSRSFVISKQPLPLLPGTATARPPRHRRYSRFPLAPRIPEGRVRFVLLRPPRCQMKFHFICRGWHDNYTCTTTSRRPRPSVYLIVRSGAICTSPLHCRSGDADGVGAGPDRAIHSPPSPSMDGMSVGRSVGRTSGQDR